MLKPATPFMCDTSVQENNNDKYGNFNYILKGQAGKLSHQFSALKLCLFPELKALLDACKTKKFIIAE